MTMRWQGGALHLTRPDGTIIFNSDEQLFHATDFLTNGTHGTKTFAEETASTTHNSSSTTVNISSDVDVGAVHANATHIVGVMRALPASGAAWNIYWRDASGTHVHSSHPLDNSSSYVAGQPLYNFYMGSLYLLTFMIVSSRLVLRRRLILRASTTANSTTTRVLTQPAISVEYRILAGFFT